MACIVIGRKDSTSIACYQPSAFERKRIIKIFELTVAIVLIIVGTSVLIIVQ